MRAEREALQARLTEIQEELTDRRNRTFTKGNFNPLDEYPTDFWEDMSTRLLDTLGACNFPNLEQATFSQNLFHAVVNKKIKAKYGQVYRSFVNSAVMLALRSYLASDRAKHAPGNMVIDTPPLRLDDPQMDPEFSQARETIPLAFYDYLTTIQKDGQIIIADNTKFMPDIDRISDHCNVIELTKRGGEGRYGFLFETKDGDLTDLEDSDETLPRVQLQPLWKLLIDRDLNKTQLQEQPGNSAASMATFGKVRNATTKVLARICETLDCDIADICEAVPGTVQGPK